MSDTPRFYTYLLRCADGSLYAGWTVDLDRRLTAHNQGRGARYVRSRRPATLAASWAWGTRHLAMSAERAIKNLSHPNREALLRGRLELAEDERGSAIVRQATELPAPAAQDS